MCDGAEERKKSRMATEFDFEYYIAMMMPDIQNIGKGTNIGETRRSV